MEHDGLKWDYINYFLENNYSIYEWEIAEEEEEKTYTIKDVVENEGKVYKCITDCNNGVLYKYIDDVLYASYNRYDRIEWKKSLVKLRKLLKYEFAEYKIEYKPEPKGITFEEALKEMEQGKVCRSLYSGAEYLLNNKGIDYTIDDVKENLQCYGKCKASHLFTSNRTEGCKTVEEFYDKRFDRKSSPFSPKFLYLPEDIRRIDYENK